jgi:hypothetical protein
MTLFILKRSQATMGNAIHMEMPPKREKDMVGAASCRHIAELLLR